MKKLHKPFLILALIMFSLSLSSAFSLKLPTGKNQPQKYIELENIKKISRAIYLIQDQYYDPARIQPRKMLEEGFNTLAEAVPEILPTFKDQTLALQVGTQKTTIAFETPSALMDTLPPISEAFSFIAQNYKGKTKLEDMEYALIEGMLTVLDPHSAVMSPDVYGDFKTRTEGEYGGLGIAIGMKDGEISVMDVFSNTPAERQGILADDRILQIETQSTTNMTLDEAVDLMRGPPKTQVTLKIQTADNPSRALTLTREAIPIQTFFSKLVINSNSKKAFGVIQIKSFQNDTLSDLSRALENFKTQSQGSLAGLVLDLRDDPGGLLTQAVLVADKFLSEGDIVYTVGPNNTNEEVERASTEASDEKVPMIVLINAGSASASEIVAGALKNNDRALMIGQRSFGKGSVQALLSLREGAMLKLTIAQYLTPGRESIQAVGIHPDIHLSPALFGKDAYNLIETFDFSEEKLESHLDNIPLTKTEKTTRASSSLLYYEERPEKPKTSFPKELDVSEYPIQLSLKLLDVMQGKSRADDLERVKPVIKSESESQDLLIAEKFKARTIDWSNAPNPSLPKLTLQHTLTDESGKSVTQFHAGSKVTLKLTAKNVGPEPLHRLLVTCEAFNPLLDHQEFVFGLLKPGQEASAQVIIDVPNTFAPFSEKITFVPYLNGEKAKILGTQVFTEFVPKHRPRFAYSYTTIDGGTPDTVGNQNGIPEKGEQVVIRATVKNVGTAPSNKTVINIKNKEGEFVFLKKARADVGVLAPDQTSTGDLAFHVGTNFEGTEFKLDFFVIDRETDESLVDTIVWNTANGTTIAPQPNVFQIAPEIVINSSAQQPAKNKLSLNFTVTDDQKIKDIAIFAKGKKKAYINLEELGDIKTKNILQEIVLEKEVNAIEIEARDERDLKTQKTLIVVGE